jgi:NAD(P)-dependent dehydrogenase (short-subunit alcohol dehydrogenase family)
MTPIHFLQHRQSDLRSTGGIGTVTAQLLRSQGAKVALLYAPFEKDNVKSTLSKTFDSDSPSDVSTYECDIVSHESVKKAFEAIQKDDDAFPGILVNTAGIVNLHPLESFPADDALRHLVLNTHGPFLTGQAFANLYFAACDKAKQSGSTVHGGRIVNLASQAGHVALHNHGPYCASKAGLIGLTKCMASEWGPRGITANTVSPGPVWTELGKRAWADPEARSKYEASVPTGKPCGENIGGEVCGADSMCRQVCGAA